MGKQNYMYTLHYFTLSFDGMVSTHASKLFKPWNNMSSICMTIVIDAAWSLTVWVFSSSPHCFHSWLHRLYWMTDKFQMFQISVHWNIDISATSILIYIQAIKTIVTVIYSRLFSKNIQKLISGIQCIYIVCHCMYMNFQVFRVFLLVC